MKIEYEMSPKYTMQLMAVLAMLSSCVSSYDKADTRVHEHSEEVMSLIDSLESMSFRDERMVATAESMYHLAEEQDNSSAKFLARSFQHSYYHAKRNVAYLDSMIYYGHLAMYECELPAMEEEYYNIWCTISMECSEYGHPSAARAEAMALLEDATRHNNEGGISFGYISLAHMAKSQGDEQSMIQYMEKALDVASSNGYELPMRHMYYGVLAEALLEEGRMEDAKRYADMELEIATTDTVKSHRSRPAYCMMVKVGYYAKQENPSRFETKMLEMLDSLKSCDNPESPYLPHALYYYHSAMRNFREADKALEDALVGGSIDSLSYFKEKAALARNIGDPDMELEYTRKLWETSDSKSEVTSLSNISDLNQMVEESRIKLDNQRLQKRLKVTDHFFIGLTLVVLFVILFGTMLVNSKLRGVNAKLMASEKESERQRDAAIKASEVKTDFIRNMNHEIRTPLNSIVGFSSMLVEDVGVDKTRNVYAERILDGSNKLLKVIDDVMIISDFDSSNKMEVQDGMETSLNAAIGSAVGTAAPHDGVEVTWEELEKDASIPADPNILDMIFSNVIGNAIKFTAKGSVSIVADEHGDEVVVEVKDTGPGIDMDKAEWIFGRFNKLDSFVQGAGLGLSIARLAAESIGGKVFLQTSSPSGSTFEIILPSIHK